MSLYSDTNDATLHKISIACYGPFLNFYFFVSLAITYILDIYLYQCLSIRVCAWNIPIMLRFFVLKFLIFPHESSAGEIMGLWKAFICQELVTTEWKISSLER